MSQEIQVCHLWMAAVGFFASVVFAVLAAQAGDDGFAAVFAFGAGLNGMLFVAARRMLRRQNDARLGVNRK